MKRHSGEKTNKCNQCDYASSQTGHLRTHLKTHSGEKSNKCNQCDYASHHAHHLRTHLKRHSGEKSNKCNECDYASSRTGNLKTHLKTHSGEKSNKCTTVLLDLAQSDNHQRSLTYIDNIIPGDLISFTNLTFSCASYVPLLYF